MEYVKSSEHFSEQELQCKCGSDDCQAKGMNSDFVADLEELRTQYGKGMVINSAERCVKHPIEAKKIVSGKSPGGAHTKGCAVDVAVSNSADRYQLLKLAFTFEFDGIALENKFIHLDKYAELAARAGRPMTWVY